jgi:hypothetical protein
MWTVNGEGCQRFGGRRSTGPYCPSRPHHHPPLAMHRIRMLHQVTLVRKRHAHARSQRNSEADPPFAIVPINVVANNVIVNTIGLKGLPPRPGSFPST